MFSESDKTGLGDKQINPSKNQVPEISPSNEISLSEMRRHKGEGSGSISLAGHHYEQQFLDSFLLIPLL